MDWTTILTGVGTVIAIMGINATLFSWLRSDIKDIKTEAAADRRDILQLIRDVQQEMKDFHGRLCAIEERNKK